MAPRRGRGIDFAHRFATSRWAEDLLIGALNATEFEAVRIGLSETSPDNIIRELDARFKVPDLLVFERSGLAPRDLEILRQTDFTQLAPDDFDGNTVHGQLLCKALCAVEVEFSPYRAAEMKGRNWAPPGVEALQRRPRKRAEPPVAPNIWIKHEDLQPLLSWQRHFGIPVAVVHLFDQEGFAIALAVVESVHRRLVQSPARSIEIQLTTGIFSKAQSYDRSDAQGAAETKLVFVVSPAAATRVGKIRDVVVETQLGLSASKKYVAHTLFSGGSITFDPPFLTFLRSLRTHYTGL
jgi:hypothetical protein